MLCIVFEFSGHVILSDLDVVEPRSPPHQGPVNTSGLQDAFLFADRVTNDNHPGLRNAREYAEHVTRVGNRALRNAREYAAHVTTATLRDAARRREEEARAASSRPGYHRYQDGRPSEADRDQLPATSSAASDSATPTTSSNTTSGPPVTGLLGIANRTPCGFSRGTFVQEYRRLTSLCYPCSCCDELFQQTEVCEAPIVSQAANALFCYDCQVKTRFTCTWGNLLKSAFVEMFLLFVNGENIQMSCLHCRCWAYNTTAFSLCGGVGETETAERLAG